MLTEVKINTLHYFEDAQRRLQGEYKRWWRRDGNLRVHCFFVNGKRHGEFKVWSKYGTLKYHEFWVHGGLYRDLLVNPVDNKDKFLITIETGGKWLC